MVTGEITSNLTLTNAAARTTAPPPPRTPPPVAPPTDVSGSATPRRQDRSGEPGWQDLARSARAFVMLLELTGDAQVAARFSGFGGGVGSGSLDTYA